MIVLISIVFIRPLTFVQAASPVTITLQPISTQYQTGDLINLPLRINTQGGGIYSVQTDISFPSDKLEVTGIDTTGTVFPLQVVNSYSPGKISLIRGSFSPINNASGLIATIQLKAVKTGASELIFDSTTVALNNQNNNQTSAPGITLTVTSPTVKPSPSPTTSTITVFAAGTPVNGVYPTLALQIRNLKNNQWKTVKSFKNIDSTKIHELVYKHSSKVAAGDIRVRFTNDRYLPKKGQDRNLMVDKINLDGVDIETERSSTFSEGSWSSNNGCSAGFKSSQWLHCNGYFEYR